MVRRGAALWLVLGCSAPDAGSAREASRGAAADPVPAVPEPVTEHLPTSVGVGVTASSHATSGIPWGGEKIVNRAVDRGWCEGAPGPGVGEAVTLRMSRPIAIDRVELLVVDRPDSIGEPHDTPTAIDLVVPGRSPVRVDRPRATTATTAATATDGSIVGAIGGQPVSELTIRIAAVVAPTHTDTCISEVALIGPAGRWSLWVGLGESDRSAVAEAVLAARRAFETCDRDALAAVVAERFDARFIAADGSVDLARALDVDGVRELCRTGRLRMPAPQDPIVADEYTGHYVAFSHREADVRRRWSLRRIRDRWRFDFADVRYRPPRAR